jgi:methyl-accepting chemotaxis protein
LRIPRPAPLATEASADADAGVAADTAVTDVAAMADVAAEAEAAEAAASAPAQQGGPRLDILSAGLSETRPVCELLSAQLEAVLGETETAALGFIEQVEAIDAAVETLGDRMHELTGRSDRQAVMLDDLGRQNVSVVEDLRRFIEQRDDALRVLVGEIRELERFSASIREVAKTSKMLAINALIEAANAGAAGAGFQIVAKHIQGLARDSDSAAVELGSGIEDLSLRILAELGDERHTATAGLSSQFEVHLGAIAKGQAALVNEVSDVRRAVEDAGGATAEVASLATGIAGHVQFQDITRQATGQVQRALERLGAQSDLLMAYADGRAEAEAVQEHQNAMDEMVGEYVIQRQRATHAEVTLDADAVSAAQGPAIELF